MKKLVAEFFGTFALVFAGTGAIIVNDSSGGQLTHLGVSITFGLVVLAMIYAVGNVSGAHLNPAVTCGFWLSRRMNGASVVPYIVSQCAGAVLASLTLRLLFDSHANLGGTAPANAILQSWGFEFVLTLLLMFVILSVTHDAKEKGIVAGVVIGAVITLEALVGGPISGASMNPARSFGPALVTGHLEHLWIYISAPLLGALASVFVCRCVQEKPCCCSSNNQGPCQ